MSLKTRDEPLSEGSKLRLYSSDLCPYAQRARLVLAAKGIPYELSEIDLRVPRPDWYLKDVNPNGTVPAMLHNGHNIYESLVCCDYLEDAFPEPALYNPDPLKRAYEKIYIQTWANKGIPVFFKLVKGNPVVDEIHTEIMLSLGKMDSVLKESKSEYFCGTNRAGMADYMIWPWFERILFFFEFVGSKPPKSDYPSITGWMSRMLMNKAVQEANTNKDNLTKAFKKFFPQV